MTTIPSAELLLRAEQDQAEAALLKARKEYIETISFLPGVTIDEIRGAARLPKHRDSDVGHITMNLPGD